MTDEPKEKRTLPNVLHFHGALKFTAGDRDLFKSEYARSEGVYIWTIKDEDNNINYVHYVGETVSLANRMREHLTQIVGMNYLILDPTKARHGIVERIWDGMWRDRKSDAVEKLLAKHGDVAKNVVDYIGLINIYFAPTTLDTHLRRHIEGRIGWNLRNNFSDLKRFYPDDNHVGTKSELLGKTIKIELDEPIAGIDSELVI